MATDAGIFIVLEGTDGSGKGTQFELLKNRLAHAGYDVASFDFPQYDKESSYFVRRYLNGAYGSAEQVGPYTGSLFYALDRYEAAPAIRAALADGKVVLANRFTGSNMAHQGTKFHSAEERRGYFIWIDNLEFELLRVPRPTLSVVLRVPAEIAQGLVEQKDERGYTDKKKDLHEADLTHMQKSVEIYDDLCNLFPKDFARLDCVRGGHLLPIETINNLLWEKLQPLLPPPSKPAGPAEPTTAVKAAVSQHSNANTPQIMVGMVENVSGLASCQLATPNGVKLIEDSLNFGAPVARDQNGNYRYHVPMHFDANLKQLYLETVDELFEQSAIIYAELNAALSISDDPDEATRLALGLSQLVLPLAATSVVGLATDESSAGELITNLLGSSLPEAHTVAKQLIEQFRASLPELLPDDGKAHAGYLSHTSTELQELTADLLPDTYDASRTDQAVLASAWPRNEFELLPNMLYAQANQPLAVLAEAFENWPYEQKLRALSTYLGKRQKHALPGKALELARYQWDILAEFTSLHELQKQAVEGITYQAFSPRHGYSVPKEIEEAGLSERFEACFDLSLKLYSAIQAAGYSDEAQYAVLRGHRVRWSLVYNARQAFTLFEDLPSQAGPAYRLLMAELYAKTSERHPLISEAIYPAKGIDQA